MSITDELRMWAEGGSLRAGMSFRTAHDQVLDIADRIDAAHEEALGSKVARAISVGEDGTEFVFMPAEELSERYMELPKDADGQYIQQSGIPYLTKVNDGKKLAFCHSLELRKDGTWRIAGWETDRYRISKPTVEDVLAEFSVRVLNSGHQWGLDGTEVIAEYAAKLRLADDGEE